ncbi:ferrous iron transport protein A [candidate division WWE3 bacterium CG_4_8_14_3_um_filter_42_11]|uniref:Ferrous iron transport protein A n=2 Tax=Katanobacteria TaxID=422282 RepID=A0A2M7WXB5_UNCKA|nr:MAG: ferrous iron transport protein A [candidate division WWE3 bacterium CG_4_9_14_3_um_filter_43_9]PJC68564.1 MAG: ferrous iron transport protein A [candidate division WWE3 bacterium CG_4_8_14_3_um_filter_42_11]
MISKVKTTSLMELKEGQKAIIVTIAAGFKATKRLSDLGLVPETEVKILQKTLVSGPIEVEARGSKLAIGRGLASKVLVKLI